MQLEELADKLAATLIPAKALPYSSTDITHLAPMHRAAEGAVTFLTSARWAAQAPQCKATAIICTKPLAVEHMAQLIHPQPQLAMAKAAQLFYRPPVLKAGISPLACVHPSAVIHPSACILPFAYIEEGACIGANVQIYPQAYIGKDCKVGARSVIYPAAVLMEATILEEAVIVHAGAVLGADGFGFAPTAEELVKIPQVGYVHIEADVEIGALATIDRATFERTIVRKGTKLDSQVHIGHNADIGEMSMLCGQVGIAGSSKLGKRCIIAGQGGVGHGLTIADGVILGPQAGAIQSIDKAGTYHGIPAQAGMAWKRQALSLQNLPALQKSLHQLAQRVETLEKNSTTQHDA